MSDITGLFKRAGIWGRLGKGALGGGNALLGEAKSGLDTAGRFLYSTVKNRGFGNGTGRRQLGRAAGLLGKLYKAPYTLAKGIATGMGASNRTAQIAGLGALGTAYYGRQAYREGGLVDPFNLSSDVDMLISPVRDAANLARWGLGHFYTGSPANSVSPEAAAANQANSTANDAVASAAGSSDAERVRQVNRAQNFGTTATPVA